MAVVKPEVMVRKLKEFTPDPANANIGTERGLRILDDSLAEVGAGRSIVTDKNGIILAGNKTAERSIDRGIEDALVVHTRGDTLVVVQRDDLDLHDPNPNNPARKLAYYDNVTSQHMAWDANRIAADVAAGLDVGNMWTPQELEMLSRSIPDESLWGAAFDGVPDGDRAPFQQMTFTLHDLQVETVKAALDKARGLGDFVDTGNENGNGNALARVCEMFLGIVDA